MGLIYKNWLLVRAPKTGGTWTERVLRAHGAKTRVKGTHDPYLDTADHPAAQGLTPFGTIRDPWSWYLSWWAHCVRAGPWRPFGLRPREEGGSSQWIADAYGGGLIQFRDVLYGATHPGTVVPQGAGIGVGCIYQAGEWKDFIDQSEGLYSWTMDLIYDGVETFVDQGRLQEDVGKLLGIEGPEKRANVGHHNGIDDYDETMLAWVTQADKRWIDRFRFEPFKPGQL